MALVKHLKLENIHIRCQIASKEALLDYISWLAAASDLPIPSKILRERLLEREQTMSTGIGNQVAVPHALVAGIDGLHAFVVTLEEPIPYDSIDDKPVCVAIGFFGDPQHPRLSLSTLATLGRMLRNPDFVQSLWEERNPEELYQLLQQRETSKA